MSKTKKFVFPGTALAVSLYFSTLFLTGLVAGYIVTKYLFDRFYIEKKSFKSIFVNFWRWEVHLHHWIMAGFIVFTLLFWREFHHVPKFFWGMAFGFGFHDLYTDPRWYKILQKNKKGRPFKITYKSL